MRILDTYIAKTIIAGALLALMVLVSLDVFFALINQLENVGKGDFRYLDAVLYVLYTLPRRVYDLFPASVLVGSLLSLGALAGNNELVAMRAAGVSVKRIMRSAAQAGLMLLLAVALLGEFLVPVAENRAREIASRKAGINVGHADGHGLWLKDGDYIIHVGKIFPGSRLQDVYIHRIDAMKRLIFSAYAESAMPKPESWELRNIHRTFFTADGVQNEFADTEQWSTRLSPKIFEVLNLQPSVMSARDLHAYVDYLNRNKLDSATYRLAFWLKIMTPVSCVVMLFIVLPFVFGSLRSVNSGQLLVIGILLGLGFYILIQIASRMGQIYGIPPFISATFPVICFTIAGMFGLMKTR
jgi:lipopolysaccharide export system permease protein